ncbi:19363_t:CDS:1, partial [Gigaspora margarita]
NALSESKSTLTSKNSSVTKMKEASTMMSPGTDKPHNLVDRQVKNKKTWNRKSINQLVDERKLMLEKPCESTKIARLEDPLDDVRNLFESEYSHQSGVGIKKDEREAPDNDRVSAPTSCKLFHCYQNETNIKKDAQRVFAGHQQSVKKSLTKGICNPGYCYQNCKDKEKNKNQIIRHCKPADVDNSESKRMNTSAQVKDHDNNKNES